ncbi:hypothetical protein HELRODRAFT_191761 [Helobdella robusta]|uniref:Uncharacterized protein n=1 Tax=Helobdella robusta TaxID=6412 RepID=T1FTA5_HELRO|nr:hypothetical protein HELRODRAFT_191761 [Helobdella robusta]ESO04332.1 hypothetical protein HELRODRAFT_191761 [Helobdella robusta]
MMIKSDRLTDVNKIIESDLRNIRSLLFGEDKEFAKQEEKKLKRKLSKNQKQERPNKKRNIANYEDDDDDNSTSTDNISDKSDEEVGCQQIPSESNCRNLDRTKTTYWKTMHIVALALKAVGINVDELTLSTSSLYGSRKAIRQSIGNKNTFLPNTSLVVHFDGKLLPNFDGVNIDCLPIVVSGKNVKKLIAIPKVGGTGINIGTTIVQLLQNWEGVSNWLAGLCFDTSSNTGIHTGAITIIQKSFNKHFLFLACRHHIFKIIGTALFDLFFTLSGPQIAIFNRFKDQWPSINQLKYASIEKVTTDCSLTNDENLWLKQNRVAMIDFLQDQLQNTQPRHGYLQLIRLSLITLGVSDPTAVQVTPPGAYHRARWMAKGIYCLKIFCFRDQLKLTARELQALKRLCLFTVTVYVKAWFCAADSCSAPYNDLCLLQTQELFEKVDCKVGKEAMEKIKRNLWYLSEDLVGMTFVSNLVNVDEKRLMVKALHKPAKKMIFGDSVTEVPKAIASNNFPLCDLIFVDGGHTYSVAREDILNFARHSSPDAIIIFDDYPTDWGQPFGEAWEEMLICENESGKAASSGVAKKFVVLGLKAFQKFDDIPKTSKNSNGRVTGEKKKYVKIVELLRCAHKDLHRGFVIGRMVLH